LPDASLALKMPSRYSIAQNRGGTRIQDSLSPVTPFIIKSKLYHHLHNDIIFDSVKSFCEVEFKNDNFLFLPIGTNTCTYKSRSGNPKIVLDLMNPYMICVDERDELYDDFKCTI
jgi:hypothetical protein